MVKGYKVFNSDWSCRGYEYEVGKTYEMDCIPIICDTGFHFCKQAKDCFSFYSFDPNNKVAEILAIGEVVESDNKCCTNKIQIVREIKWEEVLTIVNIGKSNTGLCNTGDSNTGDSNTGNRNTGNWNTGNRNTGDSNTGNRNTGNRNTGDSNTGDSNTGNRNTGDSNTGNRNTGDSNTGNRNTGDSNTGDSNTGNSNTGNRNTGNRNTGDWNQGDFCTGDFNLNDNETGCFCTLQRTIRLFDKESNMTFSDWRNSRVYSLLCRVPFEPAKWIYEKDMTDEEKEVNPTYKTTGGYLKACDVDKAYLIWWESLNDSEKNVIKSIPNFDAKKFLQITGIQV